MDESGRMEVPHLKGWFLKEKRDKFKRRGSLAGGSNRRWFTIENIASPINEEKSELALCYYKRSSENEERCGWMFLNDVLSLTQDAATKWITIEHPSRILRIQSPTPAQHRVWFSTLSKSCKNVRETVSSPPSGEAHDRRPSLPHFMNAMVMEDARRNSTTEPVVSTPKDQLKFLREITGNSDGLSDDGKNGRKNLFADLDNDPFDSPSEIGTNYDLEAEDEKATGAAHTPRSIDELDATGDDYKENTSRVRQQCVDFPGVKQTTSRIHHHIKVSMTTKAPEPEEEKSECEPVEYMGNGKEDDCCEVRSFHEDSVGSSSSNDSDDDYLDAPAKKQYLINDASELKQVKQQKDCIGMNGVQHKDGSFRQDGGDKNGSLMNETGFHVSTSFLRKSNESGAAKKDLLKSQSFSSALTTYSSSYQLHFETDDIVMKPDDNFLTDDWDEED